MYRLAEKSADGCRLDFGQERRRQIFVRRARREKRRWFHLALRVAGQQRGQKRQMEGAGRLLVWLLFGGTALGASWLIWQSSGTGEIRRTEEQAAVLDGQAAWERELFGVRIQFDKGQITIFREREEAARASESKESRK